MTFSLTFQKRTISWQYLDDDQYWQYAMGSIINYKPPSGTKQVIYKFTLAVSGDGNNNQNHAMRPMASFKLFIDNDSGNYEECSAMRYFSGTMTSHGDFRTITAVLNVSSSTNIAAGEINWNELRKIKVQCNEWANNEGVRLHVYTHYYDTTHTNDEFQQPQLEIKAIGEKTTVNSFVPHDGMTIQTQHKDYKKKVAKDSGAWDPIDDDLDTGFVVKIEPTSANSKVMISTIAHIGFAPVIMGSLLSNANKKIISQNKGFIARDFPSNENILLEKGDTTAMGNYFVLYKSDSLIGINKTYEVEYFNLKILQLKKFTNTCT